MYSNVASIDVLRTLAEASITASFVAVGAATANPVRVICFTNNTDQAMIFSDDGVNNKLFLASNTFKLIDVTTNRTSQAGPGGNLAFPIGTQFYVKYVSAPSTGAVYIEVIYGN